MKQKSECKACGRKGNWRGDKQCTMTKTANLAVKEEVAYRNSVQEQATSSFTGVAHTYMLFEDDEPVIPTAMLAYRTPTVPKPCKKETKRASFDTVDEEPQGPMEWELPERPEPEGSKEIFTEGRLRGMTYIEVTRNTPEHYLSLKKSKSSHCSIQELRYLGGPTLHHRRRQEVNAEDFVFIGRLAE